MLSAWSTLPSNTDEIYIARYIFDADGYTLQLSDLSNIWSEALTRRQLVEKAQHEKCVIDPSEDVGQYRKLLEKLEDGILGRGDSAIDITRNKAGTKFSLEVSTPLPKPLGSLTWEFKLMLQPSESLKSEIIMPLVGISYTHERRADELMRLLKEKDAAISSMLDKVESSGLDIASIFPNAGKAGRKSTQDQRDRIMRHVKGLQPFDEGLWRRQSSDFDTSSIEVKDLLDVAFASGDTTNIERLGRLTGDADRPFGSKRQASSSVRRQALPHEQSSMDEFQRQETPPHIPQTKDRERNIADGSVHDTLPDAKSDVVEVEDDSTDAEEEIDTTVQAMEKRDNIVERPELAVGEIAPQELGIPAESVPEGKPSSPQPYSTRLQPAASSGPGLTSSPSKSGSRKLGMIGGRKGLTAPTGENDDKPPSRKLGTIGARAMEDRLAHMEHSANHEPSKSNSVSSSAVESHPAVAPPKDLSGNTMIAENPSAALRGIRPENADTSTTEDTLEEDDEYNRADRRREDLKRQIEEKSKAPTKRKRKF